MQDDNKQYTPVQPPNNPVTYTTEVYKPSGSKKRMAIGAAILLAAIIVVSYWVSKTGTMEDNQKAVSYRSAEVEITDQGFVPQQLIVSANTNVTFVNKTNTVRDVDSAPYPTNSLLPGLVSGSIAPGSSYSYTFSKAGNWQYTDNTNPLVNGTVDVQ